MDARVKPGHDVEKPELVPMQGGEYQTIILAFVLGCVVGFFVRDLKWALAISLLLTLAAIALIPLSERDLFELGRSGAAILVYGLRVWTCIPAAIAGVALVRRLRRGH